MNDLFEAYSDGPTIGDILHQQRARNEHPETSHAAAEQIEHDGTLRRRIQECLDIIVAHPDSTGREIESFAGDLSGQLHKRCKDLERVGLVFMSGTRKCRISGKTAQTWRRK